jgi:ankyrin repeat protein
LKRREELIHDVNLETVEYIQSFEESLELTTIEGLTPFLIAAKYGHIEICKLLVENGCNITAVCEKEQNALHYAMISKLERYLISLGMDIEMIHYLTYLDSDKQELRSKRNIYDKMPVDLDDDKIFTEFLSTLWDRAKFDVKMVREGINLMFWSVNDQTFTNKNTPLHIATMNHNISVVKYLLKKGSDILIKNKGGLTPIDIAFGKKGGRYNQSLVNVFRDY